MFTANPEDYTNRGSIITPLKDRIQSQIMTHYPKTIELAKDITKSEARVTTFQNDNITIPEIVKDLLEQISFEARESEFVDEKSGVSARLSISAYETMLSAAERRMLKSGDSKTTVRISDVMSVIPAIIGKIEMVYEGEQEGAVNVSYALIRSAIRTQAVTFFPELKKLKNNSSETYNSIINWFSSNKLDLLNDLSEKDFHKELDRVDNLKNIVNEKFPALPEEGVYLMMEYLLHSLAEYSYLNKSKLERSFKFEDLLGSMFSGDMEL